MKQKMNQAISLGIAVLIGSATLTSCTNGYSKGTENTFNTAGKITKVDRLRDGIYIDTSVKHKGADVYIMHALAKTSVVPQRGDSMFFNVDSFTLKIDTFTIVNKK